MGQVDVRALKELMWNGIKTSVGNKSSPEGVIDFHDVIGSVPPNNAAGALQVCIYNLLS